ncbi:S8 family peptidase [Desulforamulus aeronauticus]|uniref:Subtilase family protein n=1 Tax=Desulforamulus aeronauticus DSM 10349 TaxID=1121421 RepID=A0A1M6RPZ3_9FIRM|nr:S8 family peptidase [Desulforamulus aeronauticus]SHK34552.1 Subtilase family protein [Desulforamulus aeronauticus DSM 10349]
MVDKEKRVRIILFKDPFQRGELTRHHAGLVKWMRAQKPQTLPGINGVICTLPSSISDEEILSTGGVKAVEENFKISLVPWAPVKFKNLWSKYEQIIPWGVQYIGSHLCWQETKGQGVRVAVIDSGIDGNHPNLGDNLKGGVNFVNPGASFADDNGHGTHVAGIIAASDTGTGIIGVAPEAELFAVKVLDKWGEGTVQGAINAIDWCLRNGIHVVNMSFGTDKYSRALEEAVRVAHNRGLLIVAAAGNDGGPDTVDYPAVFDQTISVAAVDQRGRLASYSSSGPEVDLLAPGSNILSTYRWGSFVRQSGSSMATAHISGAVALLKAKYPKEDIHRLRRRLISGARRPKFLAEKGTGAGIARVDLSL